MAGRETESTMKWKVDVTQLSKGMQDAKRAISLANAEFKTATAGLGKWSSSITGVEAKIRQLSSVETNQKTILSQLEKQYEIVAREMGEASPEAEKLKIKIENQKAAIAKTESQLSSYNDKLDELNREEEKASSPMARLNDTIEDQEKELAQLKDEYKNAVLEFGKGSDKAKSLAEDIKTLSGNLADNKSKMNDLDDAADKLDNSLDDVKASSDIASEGFTVMKGVLANLVADGIRLAAREIKQLAIDTFTVGSNFESSMSKVAAVSGASADEMERLTDKAQEMGEKTVFSASESADAFNYMAMAGWKTEDMLDGIEGVMNLAAASGEDLATTSDIVTDALTAMGYSAEDSGRLADVMAVAASNANTNVSMMGQTFKYAAPIVGALGFSMEDTAVAIGLMANSGIKAQQAGTSLRSILTRLSAPPKECAEAMDALGISLTNTDGTMKTLDEVMGDLRNSFANLSETQQTEYAKAIAGQEAMSGLLAIIRSGDEDYNKLTAAVNNSAGAAENMAKTMNDNVSGSITLLKSQIEGKMIKIYDKASKSIRGGIKQISSALDAVNWDKVGDGVGRFSEKALSLFSYILKNGSTIISTLKTIGAAVGIAFVAKNVTIFSASISTLITTFTSAKSAVDGLKAASVLLNATWLASPVFWLVAGVGSLAAILYECAKAQNEAIEKEYGLSKAQQETIQSSNELADSYREMDDARNTSNSNITAEYGYLEKLADEYRGLVDSNGEVKEGYEDRANFILSTLSEALGMEQEQIKQCIDLNGAFGASIDELIEKKKAEAMLTANETAYTEAKQNQATAFQTYIDAVNAANEAESKLNKATAEQNKLTEDYLKILEPTPAQVEEYADAIGNARKATKKASDAYKEATKAVDAASDAYVGYNSTIENYEGLAEAIIAGDTEKINSSMENLTNGFITAETGTKESLEHQVQNMEHNLQSLQVAVATNSPYVTAEMVAQASDMVDKATAELDKFQENAKNSTTLAGQSAADGLTGSMPVVEYASLLLGNTAVSGLEKTSEAGTTGTATVKSYSDAILGYKETAGNAAGLVGKSSLSSLQNVIPSVTATGKLTGSGYTSAIESFSNRASTAGKALGTSAKTGAGSVSADQEGRNFADGFGNAIQNKTNDIYNKAASMARSALEAVRATIQSASPAKQTIKLGSYFGQGFEVGIDNRAKNVKKSARNLAQAALSQLKGSLATSTDGLMSSMSISSSNLQDGLNGAGIAGNIGGNTQVVTFNQNITSPKALDSLTLYRQTNSLLFSAKVGLSNV